MEERDQRDWGSLAPDLLELVVQKVQEQVLGTRGEGRRVVAVAGVCRAWRRSVHQLELDHQTRPGSSLFITFPASTAQPAPSSPSHHLLQCLLKKSGDTFRLVQVLDSGDEYFLLGARKKYTIRSTYFRISADPRVLWTHDNINTAISTVISSNFWRTEFTLQDAVHLGANHPYPKPPTTLSLKYEEVAIDGNCLRRMRCKKLDSIAGISRRRDIRKGELGEWQRLLRLAAPILKWTQVLSLRNNPSVNYSYKSLKHRTASFISSPRHSGTVKKELSNCQSSENESTRMFSLRNKDPDWHEQEQRWSLDFKGRGSVVPSVHNFQLVSSDESDSSDGGRVIMQLGKLCKGLFILDFGAPLSALEALAIALSSFSTSVGLDTG